MKILGIDYGRSKVGLAVGESGLAEPLKVIHYKSNESLCEEINRVVEAENIEKIVVGVSEGEMAEESKEFAESIGKLLKVSVDLSDETLTSEDAQRLSREAGISQKKRHEMEDAYAAALMLQNYVDNK